MNNHIIAISFDIPRKSNFVSKLRAKRVKGRFESVKIKQELASLWPLKEMSNHSRSEFILSAIQAAVSGVALFRHR